VLKSFYIHHPSKYFFFEKVFVFLFFQDFSKSGKAFDLKRFSLQDFSLFTNVNRFKSKALPLSELLRPMKKKTVFRTASSKHNSSKQTFSGIFGDSLDSIVSLASF
jgi:hypothetical protein